MARSLYRFYLYAVATALLIFAITAFGSLLSTGLAFTPLRGTYQSIPTQAQFVQAVSYACVAFLIAGLLGGLHYWLIRRDLRQEPQAAHSAIRSFFLNTTEGVSVAFGVPLLGAALSSLASTYYSGVIFIWSSALSFLLLACLVHLERRRTGEPTGLALVFQRIHIFGVQLVLLFTVTAFFVLVPSIREVIDTLFFGGAAQCGVSSSCNPANPFWLLISLLWVAGSWIFYSWMARQDRSLVTRLIFHGLGLAYGVASLLRGCFLAIVVLLHLGYRDTVHLAQILGYQGTYDFFSPLVLGVLLIGIYVWSLNSSIRQELMRLEVLRLTMLTIVGAVLAGAFWWGLGRLLFNALEIVFPTNGVLVDHQAWFESWALVLCGACYVLVDWYVRRVYKRDGELVAGSRRGYVLTLLGAGVLAGAIGLAVVLYTGVTTLLGSAVSNWQLAAQGGLSAFLVGGVLVSIYLPTALREHLFKGSEVPHEEKPSSVVVQQPTGVVPEEGHEEQPALSQDAAIEAILDALLANTLSRDQAAARLHELIYMGK
ncbi:hypothetical protein KSC_065810 [Ktedonobacter sp. SOSP1-52]|uniref:hypothetical protein n=1 Tax=Ktedonobacter sp. SOSP1-52 TaxID=2778366 RepID=UPI0019150DAD|nr:hypothetical protein [Ktedonobacter sp. SOSP1-52]GHO67689.1 hypothetical protein KSC_065810 [Ktedonobacter sp. SOSP1-52]